VPSAPRSTDATQQPARRVRRRDGDDRASDGAGARDAPDRSSLLRRGSARSSIDARFASRFGERKTALAPLSEARRGAGCDLLI
jgi:hypothetical protein